MDLFQSLLVFAVAAPGVVFTALALLWLAGYEPREGFIARITELTFATSIAAVAAITWKTWARGGAIAHSRRGMQSSARRREPSRAGAGKS